MEKSNDFELVPTRAFLALQQQKQSSQFQGVAFKEPNGHIQSLKEHQFKKLQDHKSKTYGKDASVEFDIKSARHEVLRFATENQRSSKTRKKMEEIQAVKMGAKPKKKAYKNYKELLEERKRLKNIREERKKFHQLGKNQTGTATVKCRSKTKLEKQKKKRAPVTAIDQHYGRVHIKEKKKKL